MDYLEYFGLSAEPFSHAPNARFYYASQQHTEALKRLLHAAKTMKGLAILVGDIGRGKTTLARRLLDALSPDEFEAAMLVIVHAGVTPSWLLRRIAGQLGLPEPADDKLAILSQLYERLVAIHESGRRAVVIIDEAQMLGTRELMEELRGLLNLELPGHKLISFIFFGLPDIEKNLRLDPPLAQRVALRYHLKPLGIEETRAYMEHRLRLAGAKDELFPSDAIAEVHAQSRGVPRIINTLCDNVLLEMFFRKLDAATVGLVREVAENLGIVVREENAAPPSREPRPALASPGEDSVIVVEREPRRSEPLEASGPVPSAATPAAAPAELTLDPDAIAARVLSEGASSAARSPVGIAQPADIEDPLGFLSVARAAAAPSDIESNHGNETNEREPEETSAMERSPIQAPASPSPPPTYPELAVDVASIKPKLVVPAPGAEEMPGALVEDAAELVAIAVPTSSMPPAPPAPPSGSVPSSTGEAAEMPPERSPTSPRTKTTIDLDEIDNLLADLRKR